MKSDGSYKYVVDNSNPNVDALRTSGQTLTDSMLYQLSDSATTPAFDWAALTVIIGGANDNPVANNDSAFAIEASGLANAISGLHPTGNVLTNDTDVDSGDSKSVSLIAGQSVAAGGTTVLGSYGSITILQDGSYTYTLDNSNAAVEALKSGESLTETGSSTD